LVGFGKQLQDWHAFQAHQRAEFKNIAITLLEQLVAIGAKENRPKEEDGLLPQNDNEQSSSQAASCPH
jgi:hypothetical protein